MGQTIFSSDGILAELKLSGFKSRLVTVLENPLSPWDFLGPLRVVEQPGNYFVLQLKHTAQRFHIAIRLEQSNKAGEGRDHGAEKSTLRRWQKTKVKDGLHAADGV